MDKLDNLDEILEYLKTHSIHDTYVHFGISKHKVYQILQENKVDRLSPIEIGNMTRLERYGSTTYVNPEKAAQTRLEHYGDAKYVNVQKMQQTKLEKYGDKNYRNPDKAKQTKLTKYGSETYCNTDKIKETLQKHYGENYGQVIAEKRKQSNLKKYGTEYYVNTEKRKATNLEKYGSTSPFGSKDVQEKSKQTFLDHYGVDNPFKVPEIQKRIHDDQVAMYGGIGFASDELQQKYIDTCMDKYGVPYYCMHEGCIGNRSHISGPNVAFAKLLNEHNIEYTTEFRINTYLYDFKVNNYLIEIDPTATHNVTWSPFSDTPMKSDYHMNKSNVALQNGFRCVHVFDWDDCNKVINLLLDGPTIYARKCDVRNVSSEVAVDFLNKYHIQSAIRGTVQLGLYYNNELVSLMTFGKPRYNRHYEWELLRYCSTGHIIGGASKLLSKFKQLYNPSSIISYCDKSKFTGNLYLELGFKLLRKKAQPSRHWYNLKTRVHITDNLLRQKGFDKLLGDQYGYYGKGTSNEELMRQHGFLEVYDSGQDAYVLNL